MTVMAPSMRLSRSCSPRFATRRRPERPTFGPRLAKIGSQLGRPFMPWQHLAAGVGGEYDPVTGVPYYREVIVTIPRQQGKTTLFLSWQVDRCLAPQWSQPQRSVFTAQSGKDARDKWLDELYPLIEKSSLRKFIRRMNRGMGNESILWRNGSLIRLLSTSTSSGHSKTLHQAVADEIWHDVDDRREQGLRPAMVTIPDAQLLVCSTAGTAQSIVLKRKVKAGRAAVAKDTGSGIAYIEYGAPEGWDPGDEESYYGFMPALCPAPPCRCGESDGGWRHTVTMDVIRTEREAMDPGEFARAYGNVHNLTEGSAVIDPAAWAKLTDPESRRADGADVTLGVDISPLRDYAAIGLYGLRGDGLGHAQLVDYRAGIEWLIPRIGELRDALDPVAWGMGRGTYESLKTELNKLGITKPEDPEKPKRGDLAVTSATDMATACGQVIDAVRQAAVRHLGQRPLDAAVEGAKTRQVGDTIAWSRVDADAEIAPLVAITVAKWAYETRAHIPPPPPPATAPSAPQTTSTMFRPAGRLRL